MIERTNERTNKQETSLPDFSKDRFDKVYFNAYSTYILYFYFVQELAGTAARRGSVLPTRSHQAGSFLVLNNSINIYNSDFLK